MNLKILNSARTSTQEIARLRLLILDGSEEDLQKERDEIRLLYNLSHRDYFQKVSKYRGEYIVEMRKQYAEILSKKGFKLQEIADFLGLNHHASVHHLLTHKKSSKITKQYIKLNLERFIADGIYPMLKDSDIILVNLAD
jgi:hypothetical protein